METFGLIIAAIAISCVCIAFWQLGFFSKASKLKSWQRMGSVDYIIELENGKKYRGGLTCWYCYPSGERLAISGELPEIYKQIEWGLHKDKQITSNNGR